MRRCLRTVWTGLLVLSMGLVAEAADQHAAVTPVPRQDAGWVQRNQAFNERVKQGNVDLVFIGDSITQAWENNGKEVWEKYYHHRKAINLGIGGDRTQHVLWRLANGNLEGISPKAAVLMIGTNNANKDDHTAEQIADGITAIVKLLQERRPKTRILILGIFPRGEQPNPEREKNAKASELASKLADGKMVHYMDIGVHFLKPDQTLPKEIMPDFVHLTPRGYEIWAIAIEGKLRELLGEKP